MVQVTFEPLVTAVRPGRSFLLAAHFRIAGGYRISWKNPGEVGKETVVSFQAPDGFEVGQVAFPAPERYAVPGGYVGFGYQKETAVFVEIKAPKKLKSSAVHRFDLSATWVACKRECATEHTDAFLELTTGYGDVAAKDVEADLAPFKERLPIPLADQRDAQQKWESTGRHPVLVVRVPGATPKDFFPDEAQHPAFKQTLTPSGEARFVFDDTQKPDAPPLKGVLVVAIGGKDSFFDVDGRR